MSRFVPSVKGAARAAAIGLTLLGVSAPLAQAAPPSPVTPAYFDSFSAIPWIGWSAPQSGPVSGYVLTVNGVVVSRLPKPMMVQLEGWDQIQPLSIAVQAYNDDGYSTPVPLDVPGNPPHVPAFNVTAPVDPVTTTTTSGTASLSWGPSTFNGGKPVNYYLLSGPGSGGPKSGYPADPATTLGGLRPDTDYTIGIAARGFVDTTSEDSSVSSVSFHTKPASANPVPISVPGAVRVSGATPTTATLDWDASTGGVGGVSTYRVFDGVQQLQVTDLVQTHGTDATATVPGLTSATFKQAPGTTRTLVVVAYDSAGNASATSDPITVTTPTDNPLPPSNAKVLSLTPTAATLSWTKSPTGPFGVNYLVKSGGITLASVGGTFQPLPDATVIFGLVPGTSYPATITAVSSTGQSTPLSVPFKTPADSGPTPTPTPVVTPTPTPSPTPTPVVTPTPTVDPTPTPSPTVTPGPATFTSKYTVSGSVALKTLTKGSVALAGGTATGTRTGSDFSLSYSVPAASAKLTALGFLPVTAQLSIEPTGPATGTATGDPTSPAISLTSKVRIKLPSVSLLGVKLGGGTTCQASQLSTIALTNTGAFPAPGSGLLSGGTLAGTFSISNLTGCGGLNGLVSSLTAGGGNSLVLSLTPVPVA